MKLTLKYALVLVCLALLMPGAVLATEKDPKKSADKQQASKEDSLVNYADENKVSDPFLLEEQVSLTQEQRKPRGNAKTESVPSVAEKSEVSGDDPNAAMSFNFIYYIIDKFKLADPLD